MKFKLREVVIIGFVFVGAWITSNIVISTSDSLSKHVFWKTDSVPTVGNYAEFKFEHEFIKAKGISDTFTKIIACGEGQTLRLDQGNYYCDEKYIAYVRNESLSGDSLPVFVFNGVIPKHYGFMLGTNPYSGDSRYFGLIDLRTAKRVIPLW